MKRLFVLSALILCLALCTSAKNNPGRRPHLPRFELVKRQHQTRIRQQHAQRGHKRGANKIQENQDLRPMKPLFYHWEHAFQKARRKK